MPATTLQSRSPIDPLGPNDLYLPDGRNLAIIPAGQTAVAQSATQAVQMRLGEDPFNTLSGVDYFGTVYTPQPSYDDFRASLSATLRSVPDVIDIDSLVIVQTTDPSSAQQSQDVLQYQVNLITQWGPTFLSGEVSQ